MKNLDKRALWQTIRDLILYPASALGSLVILLVLSLIYPEFMKWFMISLVVLIVGGMALYALWLVGKATYHNYKEENYADNINGKMVEWKGYNYKVLAIYQRYDNGWNATLEDGSGLLYQDINVGYLTLKEIK